MIGPYKIIKQLGDGGFGKTYLAKHSILDEDAVIKQSWFNDSVSKEILLKEAKLLWNINHWALPTVKDVILGEDNDILMVMSYAQGEQLHEYIKTQGKVSEEDCCWIAQRILSALHYLHFQGIVHRDVKPANILVNFDNHLATLVDFGLSSIRPDGSGDDSGYTPFFAAPEQIEGKPPVPESDFYGLGMTMLYMLGGDIAYKKLPSEINECLKDFILRLIVLNPMARPHNALALNEEMTELRFKVFNRTHSKK